MNDNRISGVDSAIPPNSAVSIYQQDGMDDFPVLKAFQQYIDAEQAKARKRLVTMGVFFVILTGAVIAIFVAMLANLSQRNQTLNDRLVEFVMKERERQNASVVVQPPQADNSALVTALTAKLDAVEQKLVESQKKAEQARAEAAAKAAAEAAKQKSQTAEELEILRLKAQLSAEREKAAAEKERRRQEELEAYRRKHYPEHYRPKTSPSRPLTIGKIDTSKLPQYDDDDDLDDLPDEDTAISYYDDEPKGTDPKVSRGQTPKPKGTVPKKSGTVPLPKPKAAAKETEEKFTIPVEVRKSDDISVWDIPED